MKSQLFKLSQAVGFWRDEEYVGKKGSAIHFSSINYSILRKAAMCKFAYTELPQIV